MGEFHEECRGNYVKLLYLYHRRYVILTIAAALYQKNIWKNPLFLTIVINISLGDICGWVTFVGARISGWHLRVTIGWHLWVMLGDICGCGDICGWCWVTFVGGATFVGEVGWRLWVGRHLWVKLGDICGWGDICEIGWHLWVQQPP